VPGVVPIAAGATLFGSEVGTGSGRINGAHGVGIDRATGDVYVPDLRNRRIDKFEASGGFLMAWGWGANEEAPAEELQTCTTFCQAGVAGSSAGQFSPEGPQGVAVDDDPLSTSYGDVYVVDWEGFRVEKFDSSGKFLLMFGGGVNETSGGDVCVAGERCTDGKHGSANGQFEWAYGAQGAITVGPSGAVYVGDKGRVEVFEASGAWRENISLAGLSATGKVTALAVGSSGAMFVKDSGATGVREFEPNGTEKPVVFDAGSESAEAIAVAAAGDVLVADPKGGFRIHEYSAAGTEVEDFGSNTAANAYGMALSEALGEIYVASAQGIWIVPVPAPGPVVQAASESATAGRHGTASLEASVNPEGSATTVHFEYVAQAAYQSSGFASASSTPDVAIGSTFADQSATANLSGLLVDGTYHYRVVASNGNGTARGPDQTFTTLPAALIEGPSASNATGTSATLSAEINPLEASTDYKLEYGTSTGYGQSFSGNVGEGTSPVLVSRHIQELLPKTVYHYRLVTSSAVGTIEGSDHTFTTQSASAPLTLPDGREWELVSPADKKGALIEFLGSSDIQAASDGSAITYRANEPIGEGTQGREDLSQTLSRRGPNGWRTNDLDSVERLAEEGTENNYGLAGRAALVYQFFTPDLSSAIISPYFPLTTPLSPEATEYTLYTRDIATGGYTPLVTPVNVPPGTKFGGTGEQTKMYFLEATPDLRHIIFASPVALTPEATNGPNLYEWSGGRLQLVSASPQGQKLPGGELIGPGRGCSASTCMLAHSVSNDGRWVAWTSGNPESQEGVQKVVGLYVSDMVAGKTVRIGGQDPRFQSMSSDGSRIFFSERGELYAFDTTTHAQVDITASHGAGEGSAGVKDDVLGISEDGSRVYFVATGVLAPGGHSGEDNLYVAHGTGDNWATTYVTTLSGEDEKDWFARESIGQDDLARVTSRVSSDGRYLAFMSQRSLTGYDNRDAVSGQPDQEVYLYDAASTRLVCASCNPTGARPIGVLDSTNKNLLVDHTAAWTALWSGVNHWIAGNIPAWNHDENAPVYQPRFLSDSGRLFFQSADALVPQDTNGLEDVYEYEPPGIGDCTSASPSFADLSGGCVSLISSGTSASESAFFDASESGDDVFFITTSQLSTADYDKSYDIYDAHVCSAEVPCQASPPSPPPPCTSGDSCKAAPSAQPEIFGPAPSATFSGTGNVVASSSAGVVTNRSLTRAQRLMVAVKACRKKKGRRRRQACERLARRRYAGRRSRAGKATEKGGGR